MLGSPILATLVKHESKAKIDAAVQCITKRESHVNLAYAIHLSKYATRSLHFKSIHLPIPVRLF